MDPLLFQSLDQLAAVVRARSSPGNPKQLVVLRAVHPRARAETQRFGSRGGFDISLVDD